MATSSGRNSVSKSGEVEQHANGENQKSMASYFESI